MQMQYPISTQPVSCRRRILSAHSPYSATAVSCHHATLMQQSNSRTILSANSLYHADAVSCQHTARILQTQYPVSKQPYPAAEDICENSRPNLCLGSTSKHRSNLCAISITRHRYFLQFIMLYSLYGTRYSIYNKGYIVQITIFYI